MPEGLTGDIICGMFEARFPDIDHIFDDPDIGLELQYYDSEIMGGCLLSLAKQNVPVLPVHDSIRCKISDREKVIEAMLNSYEQCTGFTPKIDQK